MQLKTHYLFIYAYTLYTDASMITIGENLQVSYSENNTIQIR